MEEFDIATRFHSFQREADDKRRYQPIKDEDAFQEEEIIERESINPERLSPSEQRFSKKRTRNWSYDQIMILIKLWSKEDVLYNVKHPSYHDKDTKNNAINRIVGKLADDGVFVTPDDVTNKMHSLRVYFANKRNKLLDSKKGGSAHDDYKITWPYYESLMFLNDNVVSRSSSNAKQSNGDGGLETSDQSRCYETEMLMPSIKSAKRMEPTPSLKGDQLLDGDLSSASHTPTYIPQHTSKQNCRDEGKSDDDVFCEMIGRQLKKIPEGASKDFFKLDLYRFVVSNTYRNSSDQHPK